MHTTTTTPYTPHATVAWHGGMAGAHAGRGEMHLVFPPCFPLSPLLPLALLASGRPPPHPPEISRPLLGRLAPPCRPEVPRARLPLRASRPRRQARPSAGPFAGEVLEGGRPQLGATGHGGTTARHDRATEATRAGRVSARPALPRACAASFSPRRLCVCVCVAGDEHEPARSEEVKSVRLYTLSVSLFRGVASQVTRGTHREQPFGSPSQGAPRSPDPERAEWPSGIFTSKSRDTSRR